MNRLRRTLLAVIAAGALSTAPVAVAGGTDYGNNHDGKNNGKVTICHFTGSATNPFVVITISVNALPAHLRHGDVLFNPYKGCPKKKPYYH